MNSIQLFRKIFFPESKNALCISLNCPEILTFSPILVSTNSSVISKSLLHNSFVSTTGDVNCIDEFLLVLQYFVAMKIQRRKSVSRLLFVNSIQNVSYLLKIKFFTCLKSIFFWTFLLTSKKYCKYLKWLSMYGKCLHMCKQIYSEKKVSCHPDFQNKWYIRSIHSF